jgi:hypothetical protein
MNLEELVAKALIDADPTITGYHETHIAIMRPRARAVLSALREAGALMEWKPIEEAPKDGEPFLALYEGAEFGLRFGPMAWYPLPTEKDKEAGRFHSYTSGTQSKFATQFAELKLPPSKLPKDER